MSTQLQSIKKKKIDARKRINLHTFINVLLINVSVNHTISYKLFQNVFFFIVLSHSKHKPDAGMSTHKQMQKQLE